MSTHNARNLPLVAGRIALDFANTAAFDGPTVVNEHLKSPADLLAWGVHAGLLAARDAEPLEREAALDPAGAAAALQAALDLRRAVRLLLVPGSAGRRERARALALVNGCFHSLASAPLRLDDARIELAAGARADGWLTARIALSLGELVASGQSGAVRMCEGERCGWIFLDESRTGRRRWCDMAMCGNRAKARAHYARRRTRRP